MPSKLPPSAQDQTPAPALAGPTAEEQKLNSPNLLQQRVSNYVDEIGALANNHGAVSSTQPAQGFDTASKRGAAPKVVNLPSPVVEQQQSTPNQGLSLQTGDNKAAALTSLRVAPDDINRPVTAAKPPPPGADLEAKLVKNLQSSPTDLWGAARLATAAIHSR